MTSIHRQTNVVMKGSHVCQRRDVLRAIAATGTALGTLRWSDLVVAKSSELRRKGMACIVLWMQGGPSQFETFSPKPDHENGGETKTITTAVPGIQISENLPQIAKNFADICLIRSMTSKEGSHPRATYLLHTGYLPTASVKYPTFGSIVAHQLGDREFDLPSFVRIGQGRGLSGGGLLGVDFDPFVMSNPERQPDNTQISTTADRYKRRLGLLGQLDQEFSKQGAQQEVADHRKLYEKTSKFILSPQMDAFDVEREPEKVREAYGSSTFASGCLLARRLVEAGVTFIEVTAGNWDTHDNNFERSRELCGQIDQPVAALINDLKQRGMLEKTLVVWMGEFGRTPKVNPRSGRDHYPRAFSVALAGGGVRGGQVIGKTDAGGVDVSERPVSVSDLFRTLCQSLKIDADKENMSSIGRPIKLVDGGKAVNEVFGS